MMKKHLKGCIIGFIIAIILMNSPFAMAQGLKRMIEVTFNSVNLRVNGQAVKGDTILYNGTTYVPLRAIGELLDKEIVWDGATNTANVNDNQGVGLKENTNSFPYSSTQNNVTIKLNKVVQDSDSLRLYITYINNSQKEAMTGDSLAKIVVNGKQYTYNSDFNFDRYYNKSVDKADDFIEPGVIEDSIIFFETIKGVESINVVLNANFNDYRFNNVKVKVEQ